MTIPAFYVGIQPGYQNLPPIELYTLVAPVGEHPAGSTVSRQTLEKYGFLPGTDRLVARRVAAQNKSRPNAALPKVVIVSKSPSPPR